MQRPSAVTLVGISTIDFSNARRHLYTQPHHDSQEQQMSSSPTRPTPATSREDLLERARALVPALRERAQATEDARQVLPGTFADFKASCLLDIATPERFCGRGHEID